MSRAISSPHKNSMNFIKHLMHQFDIEDDKHTLSYDHIINVLWLHVFLDFHCDYRRLCVYGVSVGRPKLIQLYTLVLSDIHALEVLVQFIGNDGTLDDPNDYDNSMKLLSDIKDSLKSEVRLLNTTNHYGKD